MMLLHGVVRAAPAVLGSGGSAGDACPSRRALTLAKQLRANPRCAAGSHSGASVLPDLNLLDVGAAMGGPACPQQALAEALACSRIDALRYLRDAVTDRPCALLLAELLQ